MRLTRLLNELKSDGFLRKPIAVDLNTLVILDGHHRFNSLKQLGCDIIPTYLFDYSMPEIVVYTRNDMQKITKEDVIRAGTTGNKLPPRSSKHMVWLKFDKLVHISHLEKNIDIPLERMNTYLNHSRHASLR